MKVKFNMNIKIDAVIESDEKMRETTIKCINEKNVITKEDMEDFKQDIADSIGVKKEEIHIESEEYEIIE